MFGSDTSAESAITAEKSANCLPFSTPGKLVVVLLAHTVADADLEGEPIRVVGERIVVHLPGTKGGSSSDRLKTDAHSSSRSCSSL